MIRIADNFSEAKTLLKKESKRRESEDLELDEVLENYVWNLFYRLGFNRLNIGRECLVEYGKKDTSLQTKKIDVIAESDVIRAYVECTTQENDTPKIKQWISEVDDIRKYENNNLDTKEKNVVFIYCNHKKLNELDKDRLAKKGIVYLNSSIIEYFLDLKAQYSRLAYFQLVSFLCKGQLIRSLTDQELTVPAIRCKYDRKTYCYLFAIQPRRIIPLSTVPHRKLDYEEDLNNNYQRLVKKTKIKAIKKFITEQRGVFPTNIIISIETDKPIFKPTGAAINNIHHGTVTLPRKFQSLNIIDGQHRLFAYDGLDQGFKDLIYIVAFERMELEEQIKTFIDINEKQTKVSPSLLWDLYPTILEKDDIKFRISTLVKRLNEQKESSLHGLISYDSAPYSNKLPKLTLESVCTAIKTEKIIEDINASMELLRIQNKEDSIAYSIVSLWFQAIQESAPEHWNRRDKTLNLLRSNQGFGAMIKLLSRVIREFISNNTFESIRTGEYDIIINEFKDYLAPIIKEVEKIKTKEEIKTWKRIGEGGKQQLFMDFVRIVRTIKSNFCDSLIDSMNDPELDQIILDLESNSEHYNLEVKEAFFSDTKRLKSQGELHQNSDNAIKGIIKTVVAFSNYLGGRIVIGLEDNTWEVKGLEHTDLKLKKDLDTLKQSINNKIRSSTENVNPVPVIRTIKHNNKSVLVIEVKQLSNKSLENASLASMDGDCYKRENGDSVKIIGSNIGRYCRQVLKERAELLSSQETEEY